MTLDVLLGEDATRRFKRLNILWWVSVILLAEWTVLNFLASFFDVCSGPASFMFLAALAYSVISLQVYKREVRRIKKSWNDEEARMIWAFLAARKTGIA